MPLKNQPLNICYVAWNGSTNSGQTADAANHTLKLIQDGTERTPANAPAEVDGTGAPGVYSLALTATDMDWDCIVVCGKSSTANVSIVPLTLITDGGVLPSAPPATVGGMITIGTGAGQLTPAGSGRVDVGAISGIPQTAYLAQAGSANSITLAADDTTNPLYCEIALIGGTGAGQVATCTAFNASQRVATIACAQGTAGQWSVAPDNTTVYGIGTQSAAYDALGNPTISLLQPVPTLNTGQTVGDALNAARAQGFGKWVLSGTTLNLFAADGLTVVRSFTLDSATAPTVRL